MTNGLTPAPSGGHPLVSVIVCGHNGAHCLPRLLSALARQTIASDQFEVVYVDDASTDGSAAVVEESGLARLIQCETRIGLPRARNVGIDASRNDVLAFTDVDTVPDDRWIEAGRRRFEDPAVKFLAGGIRIPVGARPTIAALVDATTFLDQEMYVQSGYSAGANFWVRREAAMQAGCFNEQLEYYGGDDEEFGWRLNAAGVHVEYAPEVRLEHPPRARLRDVAAKSYRGGCSQAVRRRLPTGLLSGTPPSYSRLRPYLPPKRLRRLSRIAELEYEPNVLELLQMHVTRYFCVQLATILGDYVGERRWRGRSLPSADGSVKVR